MHVTLSVPRCRNGLDSQFPVPDSIHRLESYPFVAFGIDR